MPASLIRTLYFSLFSIFAWIYLLAYIVNTALGLSLKYYRIEKEKNSKGRMNHFFHPQSRIKTTVHIHNWQFLIISLQNNK
jgi:uncharacterized membrane protein SpoIIM required for sporulation